MSLAIKVQHGDAATAKSDLLLLKHAGFLYGLAGHIAELLIRANLVSKGDIALSPGEYRIFATGGFIGPTHVMFVGTPPLANFGYAQMERFAARAVEILRSQNFPVRSLTTTVHGVGYGLDGVESMQSLTRGFVQGLANGGPRIEEIIFLDRNQRTARLLSTALSTAKLELQRDLTSDPTKCSQASASAESAAVPVTPSSKVASISSQPNSPSRRRKSAKSGPRLKKHVFVAMPFNEEFQDTYEYGIYIPVRERGYICEKVDETSFTGDVLQRIRDRIGAAAFVIADLTEARPNVYLEVGYAWGQGVPVVFLARDGEKLHFDVSTHRCIYYKSIHHLARELDKLIAGLQDAA